MTADPDPWSALAGQLEKAARPRTTAARDVAPSGERRALAVICIAAGFEAIGAGLVQGMLTDQASLLGTNLRTTMKAVEKHAIALIGCFEGTTLETSTSAQAVRMDKPDQQSWARVAELMGYIDLAGDQAFPGWGTLLPNLRDLAARAVKASDYAPEGGGNRRPDPQPDMVSTEQLCAITIREAWALLNPAEPAGLNDKAPALKLAAAYWRACGGRPIGKTTDSAGAWRTVFKAADPAKQNAERQQHLASARAIVQQNLQHHSAPNQSTSVSLRAGCAE